MIAETTGSFKTQELPELEMGHSRYIMAKNGIFYEQNDDLFHASSSVHEFYREPNWGTLKLLDHEEFFVPKFPKIPTELMEKCLGFFSYVEKKDDVECGLVLLFNPDTYEYSWCCPEQECSSAEVRFITPVPGKDYDENLIHFGDIHLHPGMSAYHSGTDYGDEMTASDGLHLVFGTPKVFGKWNSSLKGGKGGWEEDSKETEFCGVFVSDGARFKVDPNVVIEGIGELVPKPFPKAWYQQCKVKKWGKGGWIGGFGAGSSTKDKEYAPHYE